MLRSGTKPLISILSSLSLLLGTFGGPVNAAMVGTQTAIATGPGAGYVSEIENWLARKDVREQLTAMGVSPEDARQRVAALTGQELRMLHDKMQNMPAGAGVIEVIGVVFIVLLILELVGVTNVFTKF